MVVIAEPEARGIVGRLGIEQCHRVLTTDPELPRHIVVFGLGVRLDDDRAIRRFLGELRIHPVARRGATASAEAAPMAQASPRPIKNALGFMTQPPLDMSSAVRVSSG